jgi:hypothetical protein
MNEQKTCIVSSHGCSIYGEVINAHGKLGRFEVIDDYSHGAGEYATYSEAERTYKAIIAPRKK